MKASLIVYKFKCRKKGCTTYVEKKGDACDIHTMLSYDYKVIMPDGYDQEYALIDDVVKIVRSLERKLRKK